ncbi:MAG: adenine-specific methyltransferase EcoRI family protein [Clostridia bacterium]|nr:adenine-specific methyltransferase EcoRI family protein [Clostridia bacterium]
MLRRDFLKKARNEKDCEYYTQAGDIEDECKHYSRQFRGKTILCNCGDSYESEFFKYFAVRFNTLGLKKLIAVSYASSKKAGTEVPLSELGVPAGHGYRIELTRLDDFNNDNTTDLEDVKWLFRHDKSVVTPLKGDGDFRSGECDALLDEADIVVTNPPYELFSEFVVRLQRRHKGFIILGSINSLTYKDIFPMIMDNSIRIGYHRTADRMWFESGSDDAGTCAGEKVPDGKKIQNGKLYVNMPVIWYTSLDKKGCNTPLSLYKSYSPEEYPRYDNYDAINVNRTADIPFDYDGVMGVPITFLNDFCLAQFEILGCTESEGLGLSNGLWDESSGVRQPMINGRMLYKRIFIRRKAAA